MFSRNGIEAGTISWSKAAWLLIGAVSLWHLFAVRTNGDNWKSVILSDGVGYYAYLPATFIYNDLTYKFAERQSKLYGKYPGIVIENFGNRTFREGKRINKYFIGTAVLQLPFFLTAWTLSTVFGYDVDGYSYLFQLFVCLAGIFYLLAGLYCVRRLLQKMNFGDGTIAVVLLLLFFGTNLYHYALQEPSMSHVYSFCAIAFFLLTAKKLSENYSRKQLVLLALALSLIVLIRPVNGIIVLMLPFFFFPVKREFFRNLFADRSGIALSILAAGALLFLQPLAWKFTTGSWIEYSYIGERLDLSRAMIGNVLFSWRKGFFIYTPVMLVALAGVFFIRPVSRALLFFLFIAVNTWLIASWSSWSYGGSLGMRPLVDTYAVWAIPLAFLIHGLRSRIVAIATTATVTFLIFLNLFQHYQYHNNILPYEYMTWEKYKRIFLQHEKIFAGIFAPEKDGKFVVPENASLISTYKRSFDYDSLVPNQAGVIVSPLAFSPPRMVQLDTQRFSADLCVSIRGAVPDSLHWLTWVEVKAKVWLQEDAADAKMVISFKDDTQGYEWFGEPLVHRVSQTGKWCDYTFTVRLPPQKNANEMVSVYVLKDDNKTVYVDDLEVLFWQVPGDAGDALGYGKITSCP